jgi:hypothetical protein
MRKILMTLIAACFTFACVAQDAASVMDSAKAAVAKATEIEKSGTVDSVTVADAAKGTKSEIVVADETGVKVTVVVKDTTTIYDADMKASELAKVEKGAKVTVKYTISTEGLNEAVSVNMGK